MTSFNEVIYACEADGLAGTPPSDLIPRLKGAGFDGIELPLHPDFVGTRGVNDLAVVKGLLSDQDLAAPVIAVFWVSPCDPARAELMAGMLHGLDTLGSLVHSRIGAVRTGHCPQDRDPEALKQLSGTLIAAYNHCDPAGIQVAVEFLEGGLLGSYSEMMDWMHLNHPECGVAINTASLAAGGADPYRSVMEMAELIRLVYLTEPLQSTRFNHADLFSALKASGYSGPLALRGLPSGGAALAESAAAVRSLWNSTPPRAAAVVES